jgi:CRP-like cAMP-binding protein
MSSAHFLHNVSLFANLSIAELEPLAQRLITRKFRVGEVILTQSSPGGSLYIVKSGLVEIIVSDADGQQIVVAHFGPGQAFGEFSLIDGLPRSAGAVARERSEIAILTRPEFFMFLEQHPAVAINLLVLLSRRLRFTVQRTEHEDQTVPSAVRMARLLVALVERYGVVREDCTELSIRLTTGELAGLIGCPRREAEETVTALQNQGVIRLHGLQMEISNLDQLRAAARYESS